MRKFMIPMILAFVVGCQDPVQDDRMPQYRRGLADGELKGIRECQRLEARIIELEKKAAK